MTFWRYFFNGSLHDLTNNCNFETKSCTRHHTTSHSASRHHSTTPRYHTTLYSTTQLNTTPHTTTQHLTTSHKTTHLHTIPYATIDTTHLHTIAYATINTTHHHTIPYATRDFTRHYTIPHDIARIMKIRTDNIFRIGIIGLLWLLLASYILTHAVINFFTIFALVASAIIVFVPMWRKYGPEK